MAVAYDGERIMADLTVTLHRDDDKPDEPVYIRITVKSNYAWSRCLLDIDKAKKFHRILGTMIKQAKVIA